MASCVGCDGEGTVIEAQGIEVLLKVSVPEKREPSSFLNKRLIRVAPRENPSPLKGQGVFDFRQERRECMCRHWNRLENEPERAT